MRLIDADKLIEDLEYDIELDDRVLDDTDLLLGRDRENVQFDKDCKQNAVDLLKKASAVDAISIEWITEWATRYPELVSEMTFAWMLEDWREEQRRQNEE